MALRATGNPWLAAIPRLVIRRTEKPLEGGPPPGQLSGAESYMERAGDNDRNDLPMHLHLEGYAGHDRWHARRSFYGAR